MTGATTVLALKERESILSVRNLSVRFDGIHAVRDLTVDFQGATITSVIGPNGAGKTSLLNAISGFVPSQTGVIHYDRRDLLKVPASRRAALGIGRTFQNTQLFGGL